MKNEKSNKRKSRPRDLNLLAAAIVKEATKNDAGSGKSNDPNEIAFDIVRTITHKDQ